MPNGEITTLDELEARLAGDDLSALWKNLSSLAPPQPPRRARPRLWTAATIARHVEAAGRIVTAEQAERRVIVFENPGLPGASAIAPSLYAGVQMLLPGETARAHRHTAAALRLVLSGTGGYTAVEGERVAMVPGDFIVTPSWLHHDHGNGGDQPVTWLDGLDVHVVNLLGAPFGELHPQRHQPLDASVGEPAPTGTSGVVPVTGRARERKRIRWPFADVSRALAQMAGADPPDPVHGHKVVYVDPSTGAGPLPTMAAAMQLLPRGFTGRRERRTDATVFCVVDGAGAVEIDGDRLPFGKHDVFVVPSWCWHALEATDATHLFSFSDYPLQRFAGIWRNEQQP
jgi:gentisate 1,2-dioxygenase